MAKPIRDRGSLIGHQDELRRVTLLVEKGARSIILFGREGIGKKIVAREVARLVNCLQKDEPCKVCRLVDIGRFSGLRIFDFKSTDVGKIEVVRGISEFAKMRLPGVKRKVVILDNVGESDPKTVDVLLKDLEESTNVSFILIVKDSRQLRKTIESRSVRISFKGLSKGEFEKIIEMKAENLYGLDDELVESLSLISGGSVERFLSFTRSEILALFSRLNGRVEVGTISEVMEDLRRERNIELLRVKCLFIVEMLKLKFFEIFLEDGKSQFRRFVRIAERVDYLVSKLGRSSNGFFMIDMLLRHWLLRFSRAQKSS